MKKSKEKVIVMESLFSYPYMPNLSNVCKPEFSINDSLINAHIDRIIKDSCGCEFIFKLEVYYDYNEYRDVVQELKSRINTHTLISIASHNVLLNSAIVLFASHIYYVYREAKTEFLHLCLFVGYKDDILVFG